MTRSLPAAQGKVQGSAWAAFGGSAAQTAVDAPMLMDSNLVAIMTRFAKGKPGTVNDFGVKVIT